MGAEFTDPINAWCCSAADIKKENTATIGGNTSYQFDDYMQSNIDWVVKIQANWRGKVQRMRYHRKREEDRKKSAHFLISDQLETVSKRRIIQLHILYDANEAELNDQLVVNQHKYRTSGASYEG